jgi:phospholipid N-methyltransferase
VEDFVRLEVPTVLFLKIQVIWVVTSRYSSRVIDFLTFRRNIPPATLWVKES